MRRPDDTFDSRTEPNGSKPLPLFRPEAILYQQQKFYGEIILIRPLSYTLLTWLVVCIVGGMLGLFVFGRYTEKVHLPGRLTSDAAANTGNPDLRAELAVPVRWLRLVQPGTRLLLRCLACPASAVEQTGTVLGISDAPLDSPEVAGSGPAYKVMLSLPPPAARPLQPNYPSQTGMRVEAVVPVGRKPLIQWFFERSGS
jgi:hypothetical protein